MFITKSQSVSKPEHPRTHVTLFIDIILLTIDITLELTNSNSTAIPYPWYGNDCSRRQVTFLVLWFVLRYRVGWTSTITLARKLANKNVWLYRRGFHGVYGAPFIQFRSNHMVGHSVSQIYSNLPKGIEKCNRLGRFQYFHEFIGTCQVFHSGCYVTHVCFEWGIWAVEKFQWKVTNWLIYLHELFVF